MAIIDMDKMGEALNTKADIDLNNTGVFSTSEGGVVNLTSSTPANANGKEVTSADFFQSNLLNYTTNRILEIPQDIKLELNNGTLTLKAGSKVYVPNGFEADGITPKFDVITVENDIEVPSNNSTTFIYYIGGQANFDNNIDSGTTFPSNPQESQKFYKIDENCIYRFDGTNWNKHFYSLPLGFCKKASNNTVTSIEQVFNGFGYIGSTVFVLPNVKCQSSIGRNADGTCTNLVRTVSSVLTYEAGPWNNATLYFLLWTNACEGQDVRRFTHNKEFSSQAATYSFDENENKWYFSNNSQAWHDSGFNLNIVGKFVIASGKITSFEPYTVDSILNSSLSNLSAAGQAKFDAKANVSNTVTTDTAQTITGFKAFNSGSGNNRTNIDIITNDGVAEDANSKWAGSIQFKKGNMNVGYCEAMKDSANSSITQIVAHNSVNGQEVYASLRSVVTSDGNAFSLAETTPTGATGNEIATAGWVNSKIQLVNELPANPVAGVLYCIPEK